MRPSKPYNSESMCIFVMDEIVKLQTENSECLGFFFPHDWLVRKEQHKNMYSSGVKIKVRVTWPRFRGHTQWGILCFKGDSLLILDVQRKTQWICQSLWQVAATPQPRYWFTRRPHLISQLQILMECLSLSVWGQTSNKTHLTWIISSSILVSVCEAYN